MTMHVPPVVAVDLDGVICDHISPLLTRLSAMTGKKIKKDDITSWDLTLGRTSLCKEIEKMLQDQKLCVSLPVMEGSLDALKEISRFSKIIIVSSRDLKHKAVTERWLLIHKIPYPLYMTCEKHALEADVLIDDSLEFATAFAKNGRTAILFSQPWNRDRLEIRPWVESGAIIVCEGWKRVVKETNRLTLEKRGHSMPISETVTTTNS